MRSLVLCVLFAGCTDAADVPTTVAHIHFASTCASTECAPYPDDSCGPASDTVVTPETQRVSVLTGYDAEDIEGYVQLQYTSDPAPPGTSALLAHDDYLLRHNEKAEVYSVFEYTVLYRITAAGEVVDVDPTKLVAASDNTLQFMYTIDGLSVVEDHVIDGPHLVRVETDDPGITDSCCSVGQPQDAGVVLLALVLGALRRRRTATRLAKSSSRIRGSIDPTRSSSRARH
jgi:MYXO-CTERM domain-containing protein